MPGVYVPSGKLTWEEKLEIRKHALECASRTHQNGATVAENVIIRAQLFEEYLIGKKHD
jgi:hypothetical protein